jgi:hypothetical protein
MTKQGDGFASRAEARRVNFQQEQASRAPFTPLPWDYSWRTDGIEIYSKADALHIATLEHHSKCRGVERVCRREDAQFIVIAVNERADLLAQLEAMRKERNSYRRERNALRTIRKAARDVASQGPAHAQACGRDSQGCGCDCNAKALHDELWRAIGASANG